MMLGRFGWIVVLVCCLLHQSFCCIWGLNDEGRALLRFRDGVDMDPFDALSNWNEDDYDPCLWFGVQCVDGKVETLNLSDLCLKGVLTPELGKLIHMKSLILGNNSLSGVIPEEIGKLKKLELLDLEQNNFTDPLPFLVNNILSLKYLFLDEQHTPSEFRVERRKLAGGVIVGTKKIILKNMKPDLAPKLSPSVTKVIQRSPSPSPSPSLSPSPSSFPSPSPSQVFLQSTQPKATSPSISLLHPSSTTNTKISPKHANGWILATVGVGTFLFIGFVAILFYYFRKNKVVTVNPWVTGLSGQLQKAFTTGVPSLKRSEIEAACEDFSNVIGSSFESTVYKGTLSTGVEIAVVSTLSTSWKEWSNHSEAEFRKKIEMLSKINHKNFVNLIGYCEEGEPFTRMMVFEYAPNGTLFEHLHVKESEHLDWGTRLRLAMGIVYCLEHMHKLNPAIVHTKLNTATIYLTEDFAAKISDVGDWYDGAPVEKGSCVAVACSESSVSMANNVYNFGLILLELISGRIIYDEKCGLATWVSDYMEKDVPLVSMIDPTLTSYRTDQLNRLSDVLRRCIHPEPENRPTMSEVVNLLRDITAVAPEGAVPKLSPLWWAELEIISESD